MNPLASRIAWTAALFLFVFLSGLWLNRSGRPINTVVLTVHKLIALGTLIFIGVTIYQVNQVAQLGAAAIVAAGITGLFFVVTILAGGLLGEPPDPRQGGQVPEWVTIRPRDTG